MSDSRRLADPEPMEGHGFYARNSQVQAAGLSPGLPLFVASAAEVPVPDDAGPIVIADYGSADGANSLGPIGEAVAALRHRRSAQAISVVHCDLPDNDFAALFRRLNNDPGSYLRGDDAIYASAVGRSYFEQVVPSESITLGWSSWAIQWLSRLPMPIPDQLQVAYSRSAEVRAAYEHQADDDWRVFLRARGHELRPGGRLVIVTMAVDAEGKFGYEAVLAAMYGAVQKLVSDGVISSEEMRQMAIPTVGRSRDEVLAPFAEGGTFAGLRAELVEVFRGEDRIWLDYLNDHDARRFGARWAGFSRASVFPSLAAALDGGTTSARAATFVARLEAEMAARLAAAPVETYIPLVRMCLVKG
jgi:hypothetical protein